MCFESGFESRVRVTIGNVLWERVQKVAIRVTEDSRLHGCQAYRWCCELIGRRVSENVGVCVYRKRV